MSLFLQLLFTWYESASYAWEVLQALHVHGFGNPQKDEIQSLPSKHFQHIEEHQLRREVTVCVWGIDWFWSFHISMGILYRLLIK